MNKILQILNLKPGEEKLVLLPIIYSFFIGASLAFFVASSSSLFLSNFDKEYISISFIVAGVLVWALGFLYTFLQKKYQFTKSLPIGLSFILISILIFLGLYIATKSIIIIFILYAWIRVFAYIHGITFWTLAGRIFSLQQAKRIFGLITGGEVFASILAFFSIPLLLKIINTEALLIVSSVFLLISFFILIIVVKKFKVQLSEKKVSEPIQQQKKSKKKKNIFLKNKYYKFFFLIAFLPIFAQFFADFIFQAQSKLEFPVEESLTAFFGLFFGISAVIEFILKTFVSGRLLTKYGIKFGLLAFPIVLIFSFGLASIAGVFYGAAGIFFSFVTLGRLFVRAVRTSFNDPATQILFQPLPLNERMHFQNKIESGPKAYASIIAGIFLFAFSKIPWFNLVFFSAFLLIVLFIWTKLAINIYKEYRIIIQESLSKTDIKEQKSKSEILLKILKNKIFSSGKELQYNLLRIFKNVLPFKTDKQLNETFNLDFYSQKKYKLSELIEKVNSSDSEERKVASNLLIKYPIYKVKKNLIKLLNDPDFEVRIQAIIASGKMKETELFEYLFNNFQLPQYRESAARAIFINGEKIIPELSHFFNKMEYRSEIQYKIIEILEQLNYKQTINFLRKKINHPNKTIQNNVIRTLGKLNYSANKLELPIISQKIEHEIYSFVYIVASLSDLNKQRALSSKNHNEEIELNKEIINIMFHEKNEKINNIFTYLSVVYDSSAVYLIRLNFESDDPDSRGYAIEIADTVFSDIHKELLLPLINEDSHQNIIKKYKNVFPQEQLSVVNRLIDIINSDISTCGIIAKTYALKMLSHYDSREIEQVLKANIIHPFEIIRETAAITLFDKNKELLVEQLSHLSIKSSALTSLKNKIIKQKNSSQSKRTNNLLILEKFELIQGLEIFSDLSDFQILEIAKNSNERILHPNDKLIIDKKNSTSLYITISGLISKQGTEKKIENGELISTYSNTTIEKDLVYVAEEITLLLCSELYLLNNLLLENTIFAKKYIALL